MLLDMGADPCLLSPTPPSAGYPALTPTYIPLLSFPNHHRLNDLVGSDVGLHVGKNFVDSFPERVYISSIIPLLNQHKRLGEKTGKGFYKVGEGCWF